MANSITLISNEGITNSSPLLYLVLPIGPSRQEYLSSPFPSLYACSWFLKPFISKLKLEAGLRASMEKPASSHYPNINKHVPSHYLTINKPLSFTVAIIRKGCRCIVRENFSLLSFSANHKSAKISNSWDKYLQNSTCST